jgi:membrane protein
MTLKAARTVATILRDTIANWIANDAPQMGAALAYYFIFSVGPALVLAVTVAGSFLGEAAVREQVVGEFRTLVGPEGARVIELLMVRVYRGESSFLAIVIGTVTLVFAASGVVFQLKSALNRIWQVVLPSGVIRHWLRGYLISLTIILGLSVLLIVAVVTSTGIAVLGKYIPFALPAFGGRAMNFLTSLAIFTVVFAMTFKWLPDTYVAWRDVWLAAIVTSLLFELGRLAIAYYIGTRGIASAYGAAGSLVVLLIWVYYSAQIIFFGAELAYVLARRRNERALAAGPASQA